MYIHTDITPALIPLRYVFLAKGLWPSSLGEALFTKPPYSGLTKFIEDAWGKAEESRGFRTDFEEERQ